MESMILVSILLMLFILSITLSSSVSNDDKAAMTLLMLDMSAELTLKDSVKDAVIAQIKFQNISDKRIVAL